MALAAAELDVRGSYLSVRQEALERSTEQRSSLYGQVFDILRALKATGLNVPVFDELDSTKNASQLSDVEVANARSQFVNKYLQPDQSILESFPAIIEAAQKAEAVQSPALHAPGSREGSPLTPIDSPREDGDKALPQVGAFGHDTVMFDLFSPDLDTTRKSPHKLPRPLEQRLHDERRSPSFANAAIPLESPILPVTVSPAMLTLSPVSKQEQQQRSQKVVLTPLTEEYTSNLPPLPQDFLRNRIAVGGLYRKKPEKERAKGTGLSGGNELYRLGYSKPMHCGVRFQIGHPVQGQSNPIRPAKVVTTADWHVAINELAGLRAMERIEELKQQNMWSFRQLKKQRAPVIAKTHWDYVLDEMRWLQTDVKQERRWKMATAAGIAQAVLEWHLAEDAESRAALCVKTRRRAEAPTAESGEERDDEGDDVEMHDAIEVQADLQASAVEHSTQEKSTQASDTNTATDQAADKVLRPEAAQALPPGSSLSYDQLAVLRAPLFHQPQSTTVINLSQLPLDKFLPEGADERRRTDLLNGLVPDIPMYEAPAPAQPASRHAHSHDRKHDESSAQHSRVTQASKLFDAKPLLLSTLNPGKKRKGPGWSDLGDLNWEDPRESDSKQEAPPAASALFSGRRPRDMAQGLQMSVPPAPTDDESVLEARATTLEWTEAEDNLLLSLAKMYTYNWHLIADIFNGSTVRTSTDRRDKFDVYDRWNKKFGPGSQPNASDTPESILKKEKMRKALMKEAGKKTLHHGSLYDGVKAMQKRRDMQPPKNAPNAPRDVKLRSHESHVIASRTPPTPMEITKNKQDAEKKEAMARQQQLQQEKIMKEQHAAIMRQQQAQQQAQLAAQQAQAQAQLQQAQQNQQQQRLALPPGHQMNIPRPASQASNQSGLAGSPPQIQQQMDSSGVQFPVIPPNMTPAQTQQYLANFARMQHQSQLASSVPPISMSAHPVASPSLSPNARLRKESG